MNGHVKRSLGIGALFMSFVLSACVQSPVRETASETIKPASTQIPAVTGTGSAVISDSIDASKEATQTLAFDAETEHKRWLAAKQSDQQQNEQFANIVGEMVSIPPGCYLMGSTDEASFANERPVHQVCLRTFKLGKTEVTFSQYDRFAKATGRELPNDEGWGRGNRPVININWQDAKAFAQWASEQTGLVLRLPSEAEWEYAARAGSTTKYSWGDSINCDQARYGYWDCNSRSTMPVGSYQANAFGIFDMHGNVWEFIEDCWHNNYQGAPTDGSARSQPQCYYRVVRGGSWNDSPGARRAAFRNRSAAVYRFNFLGFRLAQDL